jgi:hypothetical protein
MRKLLSTSALASPPASSELFELTVAVTAAVEAADAAARVARNQSEVHVASMAKLSSPRLTTLYSGLTAFIKGSSSFRTSTPRPSRSSRRRNGETDSIGFAS